MRATSKTIRCSRTLAACAAVLLSATSQGQTLDSRYGLPPVAEAAASADSRGPLSPAEPLISYRRDEPGDTPAAIEQEPRIASSATLDDSNPLRKSPEPPAQPEATLAAPPVETPSFPLETPPANPMESLPQSSPPALGASNPFPPVMESPVTATPIVEPMVRYDAAVQPAVHEPAAGQTLEPAPSVADGPAAGSLLARRLAPPSASSPQSEGNSTSAANKKSSVPLAFSKLESFTTAGAGLAIVVGLFLICVWSLRRGGAKTSGVLPGDAFSVLGRAPLTSQSFAHLLRLGNKLVLVAMSPEGIQPLTEVTDPMEVDRITGLCATGRGHGPSAEFKQVLAQLSREPARGFLGAEASEVGRRR